MSKKNFSIYLIVFLSIIILIRNSGAEIKIGDEAPSFTLPSTQDRLVDYYKDYYGKYHLIITFFPAAFTPI
jgi:peroxiredoxin